MTNLKEGTTELLNMVDQMFDAIVKETISLSSLRAISADEIKMIQRAFDFYDKLRDYVLYEAHMQDEMFERMERLERQNKEILEVLKRIEAK